MAYKYEHYGFPYVLSQSFHKIIIIIISFNKNGLVNMHRLFLTCFNQSFPIG